MLLCILLLLLSLQLFFKRSNRGETRLVAKKSSEQINWNLQSFILKNSPNLKVAALQIHGKIHTRRGQSVLGLHS